MELFRSANSTDTCLRSPSGHLSRCECARRDGSGCSGQGTRSGCRAATGPRRNRRRIAGPRRSGRGTTGRGWRDAHRSPRRISGPSGCHAGSGGTSCLASSGGRVVAPRRASAPGRDAGCHQPVDLPMPSRSSVGWMSIAGASALIPSSSRRMAPISRRAADGEYASPSRADTRRRHAAPSPRRRGARRSAARWAIRRR